jgi:hypothetical protein
MINYVSIAGLTALDLSAEASGRSELQPCSWPVHPIFQTSPASKLTQSVVFCGYQYINLPR